MDDYIDGINEWLAYYMPADGLMATMNTLDQSSWPMSPQSLTFGEGLSEQMKQWPKHFKFENYSEGDFVIDMTELLNCLETQEDFWTETRKSSPTDFWSALLRSKCKPTSQRLLNLIRATLVCPLAASLSPQSSPGNAHSDTAACPAPRPSTPPSHLTAGGGRHLSLCFLFLLLLLLLLLCLLSPQPLHSFYYRNCG